MMFKMGEREVLTYLRKKKNYQTAKQIAKNINHSQPSVNKSLKQLRRYKSKLIEVKLMKKPCGIHKIKRDVLCYRIKD